MIILFVLLLFLPVFSFAQSDTVIFKKIYSNLIYEDFHPINDSNIFEYKLPFYFYDNFKSNALSLNNGTTNSYSKSLIYNPEFVDYLGIEYFLKNQIYSQDKINFTQTNKPFTKAHFSQGQKREQLFEVTHNQNIRKQLTFELKYKVTSIPGLYYNQKSSSGCFSSFLHFTNKTKKYQGVAGLITNNLKFKENGGLRDINDFIENKFSERSIIRVNLPNAENRIRLNEVFINNGYNFRWFQLENQFSIIGKSKVYEEFITTRFYSNYFFDTTRTYDSTFIRIYKNSLVLSTPKKNKINFASYATLNYANLKNSHNSKFLKNYTIGGRITYNHNKNIKLSSFSELTKGDFSNNNHLIKILLENKINSKLISGIKLSYLKLSHDNIFYFYQHISNNYIWEFKFSNQQTQTINFDLLANDLTLSYSFNQIKNVFYFNESGYPSQYTGNISLKKIELKYKKEVAKLFLNGLLATQIMSKSSFLRYPKYSANLQAGYKYSLFKSKLKLFSGVELYWYSKFKADMWSPALMNFQQQNQYEIGNFIYPALFTSCNLQRARFFVMLENFTAGLIKYNYWGMPGYPLKDLFFRWGISWTFVN